jgi:hypothetical protein
MTKIILRTDDLTFFRQKPKILLTIKSQKSIIMKVNEGLKDRVIRMYAGMIIAGIGISFNSVWAVLGIPVFLSGAIGVCPLYSLMGINTISKEELQEN